MPRIGARKPTEGTELEGGTERDGVSGREAGGDTVFGMSGNVVRGLSGDVTWGRMPASTSLRTARCAHLGSSGPSGTGAGRRTMDGNVDGEDVGVGRHTVDWYTDGDVGSGPTGMCRYGEE